MTRYAIVNDETKKVVNVVEWNGAEWLPPRNHHVVYTEYAGIGDVYDENSKEFFRNKDVVTGKISLELDLQNYVNVKEVAASAIVKDVSIPEENVPQV